MKTFTYTIKDKLGIHARPAGMVVKVVKETGCKVTIKKGSQVVDLSKLIAVMGLGIKCGDTVTVTTEGENEDLALLSIQHFFEENL